MSGIAPHAPRLLRRIVLAGALAVVAIAGIAPTGARARAAREPRLEHEAGAPLPAFAESHEPTTNPEICGFLPPPELESLGPVRAGSRVTVRWRSCGREVEELELLLSLDGGRSFPLRVSPELDGEENSFTWRVPNLGAREARIRLRARVAGRERLGAPGAGFAILSDPGTPGEHWLFSEGSWWDPDADPSGGARSLTDRVDPPGFGSASSSVHVDAPVRLSVAAPTARPAPPAASRSEAADRSRELPEPLATRTGPRRE